jgi:hypothetical protein
MKYLIKKGSVKQLNGYIISEDKNSTKTDCLLYDLKRLLDKYNIETLTINNLINTEDRLITDLLDINKNKEGISLFEGLYAEI